MYLLTALGGAGLSGEIDGKQRVNVAKLGDRKNSRSGADLTPIGVADKIAGVDFLSRACVVLPRAGSTAFWFTS